MTNQLTILDPLSDQEHNALTKEEMIKKIHKVLDSLESSFVNLIAYRSGADTWGHYNGFSATKKSILAIIDNKSLEELVEQEKVTRQKLDLEVNNSHLKK